MLWARRARAASGCLRHSLGVETTSARQATGSLAHIVGEAWTGPTRCPNGHENAVRVQAWGKTSRRDKVVRSASLHHSLLSGNVVNFQNHTNVQILVNVSDRVVWGSKSYPIHPEDTHLSHYRRNRFYSFWAWDGSDNQNDHRYIHIFQENGVAGHYGVVAAQWF